MPENYKDIRITYMLNGDTLRALDITKSKIILNILLSILHQYKRNIHNWKEKKTGTEENTIQWWKYKEKKHCGVVLVVDKKI